MIGTSSARWRSILLLVLSACCFGNLQLKAMAGDLPLEVKLIWASNDPNSPDPKHKKLESDLTKWLEKRHPWKYYYQVNVQTVTLRGNSVTKVQMSSECRLELMHLGGSRIEVKLFGKEKLVAKVVGEVTASDRLVLAGDSKGDTAWFVAVRQVPKN